jgi:myb proto-oncogene protein
LANRRSPRCEKAKAASVYPFSAGADEVTTDPSDDTPTVLVTPAASLPSAGASRVPVRRSWTPEEDAKLIEAMKEHGSRWVKVAAMVPGRTNKMCRNRWTYILDPAIGKSTGKWTLEEDAKLTEAVKKYGTDWVAVAALFPGRTNKMCRNRWTYTLDPAIGKSTGKWTPEEDAKLTEAVKKYGTDWVKVATLVHGRSNHQCRHRWTYTLDPTIGKSAGKLWTPEEDAKLTEAVKKHGTDWVAVAALVPGRTNKLCRNRWVMTLDPDRVSNKVEEDPDRRQSRSA